MRCKPCVNFITRMTFISSLLLMALAATSYADDHPLFSAYPEAEVRKALVVEYERFNLPVSALTEDPAPTLLSLTGDLYQHFYIINGVSSLKAFENYSAAAKRGGFSTIFSCEADACGTAKQIKALGEAVSAENAVYNYHHNPYYLVTEKKTDHGKIYAAWFIGAYENELAVQQVILEEKTAQTDLIKVDESYFGSTAQTLTPTETADAKELAKDHPLLARYPGATLRKHLVTDHEATQLLPAPNAEDQTALSLEGDLAQHFYLIDKASTLKVFENYQQALEKAGFSRVSHCALDACGAPRDVSAFGGKTSVENSVYNYYRNPYYLLAKKPMDTGDIYVALFIGAYENEVAVQQTILRTKALETGLVNVNADSLMQQIEADGKALIYGIYFDTGKAQIKEESTPTLAVIAELLSKNPELLLYVVGHTDDTGSNTTNRELSQQRAAAVVHSLTNNYKVASARLQAEGVGPYAPESNNTTEAGKQLNRRVELVRRLQ